MQKKSFRKISKEKNKQTYSVLIIIFLALIFAISIFASWVVSASSDNIVGFKNVSISKHDNYKKDVVVDIMVLENNTIAPAGEKINDLKKKYSEKLTFVFDVKWEDEITKNIPLESGMLLVTDANGKNQYVNILNVSIKQGNNALITNDKKTVKVLVEIEILKFDYDMKNKIISIPINFKIEKQ